MTKQLHTLSAIVATLCIATFFTSTIVVELFGSIETIALVKSLIVRPGLFILIPSMAIVGATGSLVAKNNKGPIVKAKKKRMPIIVLNGLIILVPAAIFLNKWAAVGVFDIKFYIVQGGEIIAGFVNLTLMGLNVRDGLKMTGKLRPRKNKS